MAAINFPSSDLKSLDFKSIVQELSSASCDEQPDLQVQKQWRANLKQKGQTVAKLKYILG